LSGGTVHKGFGLARFTFLQSIWTFWDMSKKTIVEFSRYPVSFVAMFAQIFLMILMFMFAAFTFSSTAAGPNPAAPKFAGILIYGFIINMFLMFVLWEIGFSIREEQVRGTLESLYLSPANKFSNLVSRIFAISMWTGAVSVFAVVVVASLVGGLPLENILLALAILFLSILGILGLGFILAAVTLRLKETAELLVNFLEFFFLIFSAMFFPFSALPQVLVDGISRWLPVSYCVDAFRSVLLGLPQEPIRLPELLPLELELIIVIAFGIITPIIGYAFYKRAEKGARIKGTLAEY